MYYIFQECHIYPLRTTRITACLFPKAPLWLRTPGMYGCSILGLTQQNFTGRGMGLDEAIYTEPFEFNPDRFLPKPSGRGEPHPSASFGFGRRSAEQRPLIGRFRLNLGLECRICPGRHLAHDNIWIVIATILAVFSISKEIGDDGCESIPEAKCELEGTRWVCRLKTLPLTENGHSTPIPCRLQPRNEVARSLIV